MAADDLERKITWLSIEVIHFAKNILNSTQKGFKYKFVAVMEFYDGAPCEKNKEIIEYVYQ